MYVVLAEKKRDIRSKEQTDEKKKLGVKNLGENSRSVT